MTEKREDLSQEWRVLWYLLRRVGLKPSQLVLPAALALGSCLLEAPGIGLLVPLTKGIMTMDFTFLRDARTFKAMSRLLPAMSEASSAELFSGLVILIFATFLLKNALQYASAVGVARLVRRCSNGMRKLFLERCMTFGKLYFDRNSAGHLQNVLMGVTDRVGLRLVELQQVLTLAFTLLAYLVILFIVSWKLTLSVLVLFPLLNLLLTRTIRMVRATSVSYNEAQKEMSRRIYNALSCMLLVKSYNMETKEHELFSRVSDQAERLDFSMDKRILLIAPLQETVMMGVILLILSAMALIVSRQGSGRIPSFLVFFYVIRRAATAFNSLSQMKVTVSSIAGAIVEVTALLDDSDKHFVRGGAKEFPGLSRGIEFVDVKHSYSDGRQVLKGVSFRVDRGKLTAVVGPSGAGKTTIISLLSRFYDCAPGSILVDGEDIRSFSLPSLSAHMALVSQETMLFHDSLRANIAYGLNGKATPERLAEAVKRARLDGFIAKLPKGYETLIGDRGVQVSGGEKQRIAIARALLKGADILILDEATSALDTTTETLIQEALDDAVTGKTGIVIAHRLSTIKKADKIVVIDDGKVLEQGTLDELLAAGGRFRQYWDAQKF